MATQLTIQAYKPEKFTGRKKVYVALRKEFGALPIRLSKYDIPTLNGMWSAGLHQVGWGRVLNSLWFLE